MNISVISPKATNNGNTTLAMLLALDLANKGKKVCLTHVSNLSTSFYEYFNLKVFEDKTSTPSQLVKLIKEGAVQPEEVSDYCKKINDNLELFCNNSKAFSEADMEYMLNYIGTKLPHDYIIFDIDVGEYDFPNNPMANKIIKISDVVVMNVGQSIKQLQAIRDVKSEMLGLIENKPTLVVINKFCEIQSTIKETANCMGVRKPNNWLLLRYNPWIAWATNHGKLIQLFKKITEKDARVLDIAADINKLSSTISKVKTKTYRGKAGAN